MSRSSALTFADCDQYQEAVRGSRAEIFTTATGEFHGELTRIDLPRLWLQRGADSLARVARLAVSAERAPMAFHSDLDQAPLQHGGMKVSPGEIVVLGARAVDTQRTSGPYRWASMSLTPEDLVKAGEALAGRPLTAPADSFAFRPVPAMMARLMALHAAAGQLAKSNSGLLANPAAAKALEEELVRAMVACLTSPEAVATRRSWQHAKVMVRFEEFLASKSYEPVYVAEICAAIGASERTLRACCHEHLDMGPVRYLWLRRMHLANRALLRADASRTTVTNIATEHGFWELGRFSVEYRSLFGEPPSVSLKRPPDAALARQEH